MQPTEDSRSQTRKQGKAKTARLATHAIAALQPEGICPLTHGIGGWRHSTFPVSPPSAEPTSPTAVAPPHQGPERPKLRAVASPPTLPQHALPTSEGQIVPPCPKRAPPHCLPRRAMGPPARQGRHTGSPFTARLRETLASLGNRGGGRVACRGVGHPRGGCECCCVPFNYDTRSEYINICPYTVGAKILVNFWVPLPGQTVKWHTLVTTELSQL